MRCRLRKLLHQIEKCLKLHSQESGIIVFGQEGVTMSKVITVGATTTATALFTDNNNVSEPVFSVPVWVATPTGIVTLAPAADGLTCVVTGAAVGDVTITSAVEGDPTPGVDTVTATASLSVAAPEDTQGTITFS